jgi:hypothetical protein
VRLKFESGCRWHACAEHGDLALQGLDLVLHGLDVGGEAILVLLQALDFESLSLTGVVCSETIPSNALDASLFLFVLGLCAFARREVCFGFR